MLNRVDDLDTVNGKRKEGLEQSSRSATFERDISQVLKLVGTVILKLVGTIILKLVGTVILKLVRARDHLEIVKMADRFWKSMPAALKRPTLDELYRRLRDLDYTQIDERMAVMLNAILQLEERGEGRESATEAALMVGYTTEGISNQEQARWLSWNMDEGVRGFDLARNPGLSNNTEYGEGEFPLPTTGKIRGPIHEQATFYDASTANGGDAS